MDKPQAEKMEVGQIQLPETQSKSVPGFRESHATKKRKKKEWNKCFNPNNFIATVKFHTSWVKKENQ